MKYSPVSIILFCMTVIRRLFVTSTNKTKDYKFLYLLYSFTSHSTTSLGCPNLLMATTCCIDYTTTFTANFVRGLGLFWPVYITSPSPLTFDDSVPYYVTYPKAEIVTLYMVRKFFYSSTRISVVERRNYSSCQLIHSSQFGSHL